MFGMIVIYVYHCTYTPYRRVFRRLKLAFSSYPEPQQFVHGNPIGILQVYLLIQRCFGEFFSVNCKIVIFAYIITFYMVQNEDTDVAHERSRVEQLDKSSRASIYIVLWFTHLHSLLFS